jgi:hypothetical protein
MAHPDIETSVYRINGWDESRIRQTGIELRDDREHKERARQLSLGKEIPEGKRFITLYGTATILVKSVRVTGMDVKAAEPPPKHAIIVGWPPLTNKKKEDEARQLAIALKFVSQAEYKPIAV